MLVEEYNVHSVCVQSANKITYEDNPIIDSLLRRLRIQTRVHKNHSTSKAIVCLFRGAKIKEDYLSICSGLCTTIVLLLSLTREINICCLCKICVRVCLRLLTPKLGLGMKLSFVTHQHMSHITKQAKKENKEK